MGSVFRRGTVWWLKYRVHGQLIRESSQTDNQAEARHLLKIREGAAATSAARHRLLWTAAAFGPSLPQRTGAAATPPPTTTFLARDIQRPLVYAWRRAGVVLYVGQSAVGLRRPFGRHHIVNFESEDSVDVWLCDSESHATALEAHLIATWRPIRNHHGGGATLLVANGALRRAELNHMGTISGEATTNDARPTPDRRPAR
jgi:hypothetical protein